MLDYVCDGNVVIVSEYARLARSSADMLGIVNDLQEKGFVQNGEIYFLIQ